MANKRKSMIIIEEVLRLKALGLSQRKISQNLGIHRSTVKKYWLTPPEGLPDEDPIWAEHLDWNYLAEEIKKKTSRKILYEEQKEITKLPSYSSFCRILLKKAKIETAPEVTIRIPRAPGESVETDYSGDSIDILCPGTGEILSTELFVGTMSASSHIFADFTFTQRSEDWIESHNKMFKFYGGVPRYEITDNLKSGVTKACHYDPEINRSFNDMARHYGLAIDPADIREPKQKPNVEKSVHVLQQDFFPRIRNRTFTSLGELNKCLREYLKIKNAEVMKERGHSRDYFFEKEKPFLKELPDSPYEIHHWKKAKVHPDCHFQFQRNFYSLPHKYVGKKIDLKYSSKIVHAYIDMELIYSHQLGKGKHQYITNDNHYPEEKLVALQMNIQAILKRAERVGENTLMLIERLFKMPRFPLKNLRKVQAVMGLTKKYSKEAIEYACGTSLERNKYGFYFINSCAKNYRKEIDLRVNEAPSRQLELICLQGGKRNE